LQKKENSGSKKSDEKHLDAFKFENLRQPVTGCLFSNIYAAAAGKGHAKCL
jgi:hypothetical protein